MKRNHSISYLFYTLPIVILYIHHIYIYLSENMDKANKNRNDAWSHLAAVIGTVDRRVCRSPLPCGNLVMIVAI